jgi:hypothetical protein
LTIAGAGARQSPTDAATTTEATADKGAVATSHPYGSGRAVTLTFDPELNDNPAMRELLVDAIEFAAGGATLAGVANAAQFVQFTSTLAAPAGPLDMELDAWPATSLTIVADGGGSISPPRTWTFPLASGTPVAESLGVTASAKGTYPVLGELSVRQGTSQILVAQTSIDVMIVGSASDLKAAAIAAVSALPAGGARTSALSALNQVNAQPATKSQCDSAINLTLQATDALKPLTGAQATDARVQVDRLLRSLEVLYATLP